MQTRSVTAPAGPPAPRVSTCASLHQFALPDLHTLCRACTRAGPAFLWRPRRVPLSARPADRCEWLGGAPQTPAVRGTAAVLRGLQAIGPAPPPTQAPRGGRLTCSSVARSGPPRCRRGTTSVPGLCGVWRSGDDQAAGRCAALEAAAQAPRHTSARLQTDRPARALPSYAAPHTRTARCRRAQSFLLRR